MATATKKVSSSEAGRTKKERPAEKRGKKSTWEPIFLVLIYKYARQGMLERSISQLLGISRRTFATWKQTYPEIQKALDLAYESLSHEKTDFARYCYERLSEPLQDLWDKIRSWEVQPGGISKIEALLKDQGKSARQSMYLQALVSSNFSPSMAGGKVGVDKVLLDKWLSEDSDFAELVEQIIWHKSNFYEESLISLVKEGNASATIFANKTWNRSRGYGLTVEHSGQINHNVSGSVAVGVVDLTELIPWMSEEVKNGLLDAIQKREDEQRRLKLIERESPLESLSKEIANVDMGEEGD